METGNTSKHFNDVYYSNSTCSLPCLHTPKNLTKRGGDLFYIPMFSYDHSCGHFSVQQTISLASDLGSGRKWNGRNFWKVFSTGAYSLSI